MFAAALAHVALFAARGILSTEADARTSRHWRIRVRGWLSAFAYGTYHPTAFDAASLEEAEQP
jgi:hypothetical protein